MSEIEFSDHSIARMKRRGASEEEVRLTIEPGVSESARKGRLMFRYNFAFNSEWEGQRYRTKQVAPVVVHEGAKLVVVTVYTFYF